VISTKDDVRRGGPDEKAGPRRVGAMGQWPREQLRDSKEVIDDVRDVEGLAVDGASLLRLRWRLSDIADRRDRLIERLCGAGRLPSRLSPFGRFEGRWDLRGLWLPDASRISGRALNAVDLSHCSMRNASWLDCKLTDCLLDHADLARLIEERCSLRRCSFRHSIIEGALLGVGGSRYDGCTFMATDLSWAQLARPRFGRCRFESCEMDGLDLSSASLSRCSFAGDLVGVRLGTQSRTAGACRFPLLRRRQRLTGIDITRARLSAVTFGGGCALSSFELGAHHRFFDSWQTRVRCAVRYARRQQGVSWDRIFAQLLILRDVAGHQQHWIVDMRDLWRHLTFDEAQQLVKLLAQPQPGNQKR